MSNIKVAVIGGSGIYKLDAIKVKNQIKLHTPFCTHLMNILLRFQDYKEEEPKRKN